MTGDICLHTATTVNTALLLAPVFILHSERSQGPSGAYKGVPGYAPLSLPQSRCFLSSSAGFPCAGMSLTQQDDSCCSFVITECHFNTFSQVAAWPNGSSSFKSRLHHSFPSLCTTEAQALPPALGVPGVAEGKSVQAPLVSFKKHCLLSSLLSSHC